ncbi:glycosyltransferase family 2 protein [Patescibacteria group bacterium]|nr:glycosyltransferase family 2 protein [Patescibacteria group bacterium]
MKYDLNLSIVIVNWNVKDLLEQCLTSIFDHTTDLNFEVIVVDNASPDQADLTGMMKQQFPEVKYIPNNKNLGFARANNQAIVLGQGEFVLLMNPDTELRENSLLRMVNFMRQNEEVGISGCKILNTDHTVQPSIRKFPNLFSQILIMLKLHHFFVNISALRNYFQKDFDYNLSQAVDQVRGAFFMMRKTMIDKVGVLDDKYWIWFEEVDYCKRAKDVSWEVWYFPTAEVFHHWGQSFQKQERWKKQFWFNNSLLRYFFKHQPFWQSLLILLFYPVSLLITLLLQLLIQNKKLAKQKVEKG